MSRYEPSNTTVGIVGLGYVGLPLALAMTDAGYDVIGVDVDEERVAQLEAGTSYLTDVSDEEISSFVGSGFEPTVDYDRLSSVDAVSICVPTPLRKTGQPNLSYVVSAVEELATVVPPNCVVILESTVYPGATEEVLVPALEAEGFEVGSDIFVAFSPERLNPGQDVYKIADIPKVIGGVTPRCSEKARAVYESVFSELVPVESSTEAELVKLLENTFRAVNIGLINEVATIADELDVDIWDTIDAASTKPYGFMPFYPGPGLGGHCIPVDPMYLSWQANQKGTQTRFIELADHINRSMPGHVVSKVGDLLNDNELPFSLADVLIIGVAYKGDVSDVRESPAFDVVGELQEKHATIRYHDPHVPTFEVEGVEYDSTPLTEDAVRQADCVVVLTDHEVVDYDFVAENASLVFDTRNATPHRGREWVHRL
ncbi:nucleotide sugar dehydrogenase [Haloferax sp. YSMS24]|uniref:nucleotide sugar dehydrogenase n=1 Tax=Haloferax sp. YSMS24 TaxID=3388425 RepID=UPI00398CF192